MTPPANISPAERLDALVQILAEGIICLGEKGLLEDFAAGEDDEEKLDDWALTSGGNEGIRSCGESGPSSGGLAGGGEYGE